MEEDTMMKAMFGGIMVIMMMVVLVGCIQGVTPEPPTPPLGYKCPYCDQTFPTLEELVSHVATDHPDQPPIQPIDITWE